MTRGLSGAQRNAIAKSVVGLAHGLYLATSPAVYAWTGTRNITSGGKTYLGFGQFSFVESVSAERSSVPSRINVGIHGVPTQNIPGGFVSRLLGTPVQGKTMTLYGIVTTAGGGFNGPPFVLWTGFIDHLSIAAGDTISITVHGEHYASIMRRSNGKRATIHSHNLYLGRDPTTNQADMFFQYNTRLAMRNARKLT